jgi:hypothetical protein
MHRDPSRSLGRLSSVISVIPWTDMSTSQLARYADDLCLSCHYFDRDEYGGHKPSLEGDTLNVDQECRKSKETVSLLVSGKASIRTFTADSPHLVNAGTDSYSTDDTDVSSSEDEDPWFGDDTLDVNDMIDVEDAITCAEAASSCEEDEPEGSVDEDIVDGD